MSIHSPNSVASQIGSGLLSFPVTHLSQDNAFSEGAYREHLEWLISHKPAGLFAAGGTGEFFSLSIGELKAVVEAAVAQTNGRVPVIAGCGYGTSTACDMAAIAEQAGADGILLLPPYLVNSEQEGLAAHIEAVCKSTSLAVIIYNRDNAIVSASTLERLCESCPNLVGYKDGVGDVELMVKISNRMGDRLVYVGGLPTAETFAFPYLEMGVTTYSSAIFNFAPAYAQRFYAAVRAREFETVSRELRDFVLPFTAIRDRRKGYAVSIIKAGLKIVGRPAGPVRGPLLELSSSDMADLQQLLNKAGIA